MSIYSGQKIAFLTQHGKERVVAPVLEPALACVVQHIGDFDTDQLGTFTRDTPRLGTQLDAARQKARMGMELSGLSLGIASEGSFGLDPFSGMFSWNVELLVLLDDMRGIEIVGMAQGVGRSGHLQTKDWLALEAFAKREGFPEHHLVLRPNGQDDPHIRKGIADWASLRRFFDDCLAQSDHQQVFAETDLRAFANPSRMAHIEQAARDLLQRIVSTCSRCDAPGFWVVERVPGLLCSACGTPSNSYRSEVWQCLACHHRENKVRADKLFADPQHCARCNP